MMAFSLIFTHAFRSKNNSAPIVKSTNLFVDEFEDPHNLFYNRKQAAKGRERTIDTLEI